MNKPSNRTKRQEIISFTNFLISSIVRYALYSEEVSDEELTG